MALSLYNVIQQVLYPRALTALVVATLAVLFDFVLRFGAYRNLLHSLSVAGSMKALGAFMLVFLQLVALFYLFTLLPRPLQVVVFLFAVFIVIIQCSYWMTLSQFMTSTDLFLALTVSGDHRREAILSFFNPNVVLYALPYALVLSLINFAPQISDFRVTVTLSLLSALYLVASNFALFLYVPELSFHLNPLTSFLRSALSCTFENLRKYHGPRDELPTFHVSQPPTDNIIYVIDESVRGSNLSLNGYPRATTPFLQALETQGLLKNLGICVAAASFTHISNAYLITGHNSFPDNDFRTEKNPTIFDYAKKMGYKTVYIDINQAYLASLIKAAGDGNVRSLDRWMTEKSFQEHNINLAATKDVGVARFLSTVHNENKGYFILVNKKGLHFHYSNNYPNDGASTIWKPVMNASQSIDPSAAGREKLVNTYDNGIRFQVDEFFREFISTTTNQNYTILYTSDHGQTLAESGQVYTHMKPDKEVVDVPNFLVSGEEFSKKGLLDDIPPGIRVSHLNIFATLLDLMSVPKSLRVRSYDKSIFTLTEEDNRSRHYMSGSLHGSGDYVVKAIHTPPEEGWGISKPPGNNIKSL